MTRLLSNVLFQLAAFCLVGGFSGIALGTFYLSGQDGQAQVPPVQLPQQVPVAAGEPAIVVPAQIPTTIISTSQPSVTNLPTQSTTPSEQASLAPSTEGTPPAATPEPSLPSGLGAGPGTEDTNQGTQGVVPPIIPQIGQLPLAPPGLLPTSTT